MDTLPYFRGASVVDSPYLLPGEGPAVRMDDAGPRSVYDCISAGERPSNALIDDPGTSRVRRRQGFRRNERDIPLGKLALDHLFSHRVRERISACGCVCDAKNDEDFVVPFENLLDQISVTRMQLRLLETTYDDTDAIFRRYIFHYIPCVKGFCSYML